LEIWLTGCSLTLYSSLFQCNAANQELVLEALNFIARLAGPISPTINRTKAQILGEKL
jgi:hypothetical protein